ncbi:diaminohydroxyphosphoribosylaminopyrimidine deaminase/5-amino-6-(5-phosphoribosylamino)uracil reductase [Gordonia effusa NBRC 100432]|uniref:Riboflavin biosynthesis protein RibD n=1 Tax=Gordonia effusa NBRC 100432 TaxID=1077974 RepID=H0QZF8_9ACTN|nr:bifunctional diaminohydroxyphosphoribosylaminopyrimidine deaminase/5-amino-6-(5-phosphoribosylamino)uracil reductase RibD [Gordonia effusa]GAB18209.1 diaminohydroxyphosphoribosylaminopyrimidine deaminase/5-amino-6-(5-phosphoribosylamino)uracil reductase [Gordonia effusa NBRC 100432]
MPTELSVDGLHAAMTAAIAESVGALGISSPNPPVGAVILDAAGNVVGIGHTQPAGSAHAEVMALRAAGERARGGTAVVTLEPCNHTGRTGPCSRALLEAGVSTVYYGVADPNPAAAGGAATLSAEGVRVIGGADLTTELTRLVEAGPLRAWLHRQRTGLPLVTAKIAATVDGRIAAPDGTSRWITGERARAAAHEQRGRVDAIIVGTGTVRVDNPSLTARFPGGELREHQPIRIVMGNSDIGSDARVLDEAAQTMRVRTHNPLDVLAAVPDALWVLVEGGPRVIGAFLAADIVDEVDLYLAPAILGAGYSAVEIGSATTISDLRRFTFGQPRMLGEDLLVTLRR